MSKYEFNRLITWKETLRDAKQLSFLCDSCKQKIEDALKRVQHQIDTIIEESDGVIF